MQNELINSQNEKLVPAVHGSFIAPFSMNSSGAADDIIFLLYSPDDPASKSIRIKRIKIDVLWDLETLTNTRGLLNIIKFFGTDVEGANMIVPTYKNSDLPSPTAQAGCSDSAIAVYDIGSISTFAKFFYTRRINSPQSFELNWTKSLDPKDHLIIPPTYGIGIQLGIAGNDKEFISGFVEWDELV